MRGFPGETGWHETDDEVRRLEQALACAIRAVEALSKAPDLRAAEETLPTYGRDASQDRDAYRASLEYRAPRRAAALAELQGRLAGRDDRPTISVLTPVYRPDPETLRRCVGSVRAQLYDRWEHCLCDDGSGDPAVTALLRELAAEDSRIRVAARSENGGISAATNVAASIASGEFVALLDQDDELERGILTDVAARLMDDPDIDFLYTDEDKLDEADVRCDPFFKPDWSPDQLLSHMYVGHLGVIRKSLFDDLGGMRSAFDGSQDYDLALRVTERARAVAHIPEVGYHWRKTAGSTAQEYAAKPYADRAARAALMDALERRGEEGVVESGLHEGTFRVRRTIRGEPLVSIIIPFRDGAELLRRGVESLPTTAGYDRWEAILVDNQSWEPETRAVMPQLLREPRCRVVEYPGEFNWAAINNFIAGQCEGDLLLFLNSDIEGRAPGWLSAMVEHVQRPEVGAVGARLLYPNERVQHTGVVMGMGGGIAWHAFCYCPADQPGYFGQAKVIKNYSAVTGACMLVRRTVFEEVGGFDERLAVSFNDIDFCLRLRAKGYRIVSTPFAELVHYESATRGRSALEREESRLMIDRWADVMRRDPYFNPNLDLRRTEFAVRVGPEEVDPWRNLLLTLKLS